MEHTPISEYWLPRMKIEYMYAEQPLIVVGYYNGQARVLVGHYTVTFDDGFRVMIPHDATIGTVGAIPLDMDDEYEFGIIAQHAIDIRGDQ